MPPHRALQNHDVVREIFQCLTYHDTSETTSHFDNEETYSGLCTLARTARVCRALSDLALDVLWRKLDSIVPLFKILSAFQEIPEDDEKDSEDDDREYWEKDDTFYGFYGEITSAEWTRFQSYARRVRVLHCGGDNIDRSVFFYLYRQSQGKSLVPFIQKITWCSTLPWETDLLTIISPTLLQLHLHLDKPDEYALPETPYRAGHRLKMLLTDISSHAPLLEELVILGYADVEHLQPIAGYIHLRRLDICQAFPYNVLDILHGLSALQHLAELKICLPQIQDDLWIPDCRPGFPSLRKLDVTGDFPQLTQYFLKIEPPVLQSLHVTVEPLGWTDAQKCRTCLATAYSQFGASLVEFEMDFDDSKLSLYDSEEEYIHFIDLIRPILCCHAITKLCFSFPTTRLAMSDEAIEELATSCPRLRELRMVWMVFMPNDIICPTIKALHMLARLSPYLQELSIPLREGGCEPPEPNKFPVLSRELRHLNIDSPVETGPAWFIEFLLTSYPNLQKLGFVRRGISTLVDCSRVRAHLITVGAPHRV